MITTSCMKTRTHFSALGVKMPKLSHCDDTQLMSMRWCRHLSFSTQLRTSNIKLLSFCYWIVFQSWDTSSTLNGMPNISSLSLSFAASWLSQEQQWFLMTVLKSNVVYLANALLFILMYSRRVIGRGGSSQKFCELEFQQRTQTWKILNEN